jgi:D-sedoheptulose 7-phosphate isomerase
MLEQRIQQQFFDSADLQYAAAEVLAKPIADAVSAIVGCITAGGKVLACGEGGSACDADLFATEFSARFERERPGLAALSLSGNAALLTRLAGSDGVESIFARQVESLGAPGDVLLALSADGQTASVLAAVEAAHAKDMTVVAFSGRGGVLRERLIETDVSVSVPHERAARVQEVHRLALHCICDAVDLQLLGEEDNA